MALGIPVDLYEQLILAILEIPEIEVFLMPVFIPIQLLNIPV